MAFKVTFVSANGVHLGKSYTTDGVLRPPHAKNLTSVDYEVTADADGVRALGELIRIHTGAGDAFFTGAFTDPLDCESRAGRSDIRFKPQVLCIDIDNLAIPEGFDEGSMTDRLRAHAWYARGLLPGGLSSTACVVHASSSFGMKPGTTSLHLFFILDKPFAPTTMKTWLTQANMDIPEFADNIALNPSGLTLHYPLDRCTAENTRLIYIAAPKFDSKLLADPFDKPVDRVLVLDGSKDTCDLSDELRGVNASATDAQVKAMVKSLRSEAGMPRREIKTKTIEVTRGVFHDVVTNADPVTIEVAYEREPFVYANLNGGDSNAYYWRRENPRYIFNFKDEPILEMPKVAPEFYREQLALIAPETADLSTIPLVIRDRETDTYRAILYDSESKALLESNRIQRGAIDDFLVQYGEPAAEMVETWSVFFDPANMESIDFDMRTVNTFTPTKYMTLQKRTVTSGSYGSGVEPLRSKTPGIYKLLAHIINDTGDVLEHFINWLAYVFQYRRKTATAWIFHGVEGTGKGIFFHRVISPLFGRYGSIKKINDLEDTFNLWRETSLLVVFDEFRLGDAREGSRTYERLKNMISEPYGTVRGIAANQRDVPMFDNFLFFSNSMDALKLASTDRRFTVPEAQLLPLNQVTDTIKLVAQIDKELEKFAQFLVDYKVDEQMAMMVLDTAAKKQMRLASNTWVEDLCVALKDGDLVWLLDNVALAKPLDNSRLLAWQHACRSIGNVVQDIHRRPLEPTGLSIDDMVAITNVLTERPMTKIALSKMLARHGIAFERMRVRGERGRWYTTLWNLDDLDPDELISTLVPPEDQLITNQRPDKTH